MSGPAGRNSVEHFSDNGCVACHCVTGYGLHLPLWACHSGSAKKYPFET
jgi:hypothetical protein